MIHRKFCKSQTYGSGVDVKNVIFKQMVENPDVDFSGFCSKFCVKLTLNEL